jgi:hypothetical protein
MSNVIELFFCKSNKKIRPAQKVLKCANFIHVFVILSIRLKKQRPISEKKVLLQFNFNPMATVKSFFQTFKPGIPKQYLLFVAAFIWTIAGGMLLFRGFSFLKFSTSQLIFEESCCILTGILFYKFMFSKISLKHIHRILNIQLERPCLFSFFNWRSYFLMSLMISFGVTLRVSGIVPLNYLSLFYVAMGIPLFMSAIRFYYYAFKNLKMIHKGIQDA